MPTSVLRPLSLGEVLDVAFGLYRRLFVPLLVITIATRVLPAAVEVYVQSAGGLQAAPGFWLLNLLLSAVLSGLAAGASTFVVSEYVLGRSLTAGQALARTVPYLWPLVVLAVGTGLVVFLGFLLFVIPGLIVLSGLALGTPALVLEGLSGIEAMGRSWSLTRGYRRKVFWAVATAGLLVYLPGLALGGYLAGAKGGVAVSLALTSAVYVLSTLVYPLLYCVMTVAYYDLRVRKEGFDLEVLVLGLEGA